MPPCPRPVRLVVFTAIWASALAVGGCGAVDQWTGGNAAPVSIGDGVHREPAGSIPLDAPDLEELIGLRLHTRVVRDVAAEYARRFPDGGFTADADRARERDTRMGELVEEVGTVDLLARVVPGERPDDSLARPYEEATRGVADAATARARLRRLLEELAERLRRAAVATVHEPRPRDEYLRQADQIGQALR